MPSASVTSKGQITIPKPIRETLKLHPGDRVDFITEEDGRIVLKRASFRIEELAGMLKRPAGRPVSIEEMNEAIRTRGSRR